MRVTSVLAIGASIGLVGCSAPTLTRQQITVATEQVQQRVTDWTRYVNNRELDSLAAMYDHSPMLTVGWADGARTRGFDNFRQQLDAYYASLQFLNMGPQNPEISILAPGIAVVSFRYSVDVQLNDTRRDPYSGQALLVWMQQENGDWVIGDQLLSRNP